MGDSLDLIRATLQGPADAVRWACTLEATAPKVGNVFPGKRFKDLGYSDFVVAAEIAAPQLTDTSISLGARVLNSIQETRAKTGTNVNLGIVLLLAPLVQADQENMIHEHDDWIAATQTVLMKLTSEDSRNIFSAIGESAAGGLGTASEMDVNAPCEHDDIVRAMHLAMTYDRIAVQYATAFRDLVHNVAPIVQRSLEKNADLLRAIGAAQLKLLSVAPDSLIQRKRGEETAAQIQKEASRIKIADREQWKEFDQRLREDGNELNPGTTADLIAAALYVILRTPNRVIE